MLTAASRLITKTQFEVSDHTDSLDQSGKISREAIMWLAIAFAIVPAIMGLRWVVRRNNERARTEWKAATLQRLAGLSITNEAIRRELDELKGDMATGKNWGWATEHVLLMTNGEYLVYAFRHDRNEASPNHLFLAHSSDGRWLYSNFHFCNRMVGVMFENPPGSISEFEKRYAAREFDGKSDECLKHTWPVK